MSSVQKIIVNSEVEVNQEWIDYCVIYNDLFMYSYCGYWMAGMERDPQIGWLCYEYDIGVKENPSISDVKDHPDYNQIVETWKGGAELPKRWHRLDTEAAIRAYKFGVERYGVDWYENGDATTYDCVVQLALLGELVYG